MAVNSREGSNGEAADKQVQATPEKDLGNLLEYDDVLTQKKSERQYIFEGRHEEGFNESFHENNRIRP